MLNKLKTFYAKLSAIFLILILLLGVGVVAIAFSASSLLFDEVEQLLNRDYAESIALEIEPFVKEGFSEENIKDAIHYMMVLNPMVEIYLIDGKGSILSYFAAPGDKIVKKNIDLTPLNDFINRSKELPITGDDPRSIKNRKPFSAAPLKMGLDNGFVYVILRGENYDRSINKLSSRYYLKTGSTTLIFAIILTLFLGLLLFFILTKRLRDLNNTVADFKNGDYLSRIKVKGNDELSFLGDTFNKMAEAIIKTEKEKNDLISNISHDLRSPLTAIRGHLETVIFKDEQLKPEERKQYLNITLKNIDNFQALVDRLFELTKLENNQIKPLIEPFQLAELSQDVVMKLKPTAKAKNVDLIMKQPEINSRIKGDIAMIERVISNLLENAIHYSPQNSEINISLFKESEFIRLFISDNGYGIEPEELPHIFDRFYRGDIGKRTDVAGSGLGLAIVKEIIHLHKGTIDVTSKENIGTTFIVSLPF